MVNTTQLVTENPESVKRISVDEEDLKEILKRMPKTTQLVAAKQESVKRVSVDEETLKEILKRMPKEYIEKQEPKNVLTKIMIEGRSDKLLNILTTIMSTYIEKDVYGHVNSSKTKNLVMTFMLEEKPKDS